ncbi:hypothetical protein BDY19DRAFT_912032, partial [Irpex rosettiformis]
MSLLEQADGGRARRLFGIVVDKSTSDAISCGEDISFGKETLTTDTHHLSIHPMLLKLVSQIDDGTSLVLEPLEILAVHLASLVEPGGLWIALSYSSHRFPFLTVKENGEDKTRRDGPKLLDASRFWEVEKVEQVDALSGGNVYAPTVQHHLYMLRRTDVPA